MTTDTEIKKVVDDLLISIAQKHFPSVETLEVRNSDSLDFHEVYVESIRDALKDAFITGMSCWYVKSVMTTEELAQQGALLTPLCPIINT